MRIPQLKILVVALTLLAAGSAIAATVWKWVDKGGVTHYSDQPVPGAIQIDLSVQTYDAAEATIPVANRVAKSPNKAAAGTYLNIEISQPANEQTITGTGGQVSVGVRIEPGMQPGDSVRLDLDGQRVSEPNSAATNFELKEVARGTHTLSASVVTSDGRVAIQSAPITFFMFQQTALRKK